MVLASRNLQILQTTMVSYISVNIIDLGNENEHILAHITEVIVDTVWLFKLREK